MQGGTNASNMTNTVETFALTPHSDITIYNMLCRANNRVVHIDVDMVNTSASSITAQSVLATIPDKYMPEGVNGTYPLFEIQFLNGAQVYGGIGWGGKKGIFLDNAMPSGARFRLSITYFRAGGGA